MKKNITKTEKKNKKFNKKINWKVVIYSILGLACVVLSFTIDWAFLLPAVILMLLNQRELNKKR
ncbi:MAG: hypothetical protein WC979_06065 [Candidatus Pacearchaeota archaeon]|jgi:hypothetical protein